MNSVFEHPIFVFSLRIYNEFWRYGIPDSSFHCESIKNSALWQPKFAFPLWIYTEFYVLALHSHGLCNSSTAGRAFTANPLEAVEQFSNGFSIEVCLWVFQQSARRGPWGSPRALCLNFKAKLDSINAKFLFTIKAVPYTPVFFIQPNSRSYPPWGSYL